MFTLLGERYATFPVGCGIEVPIYCHRTVSATILEDLPLVLKSQYYMPWICLSFQVSTKGMRWNVEGQKDGSLMATKIASVSTQDAKASISGSRLVNQLQAYITHLDQRSCK